MDLFRLITRGAALFAALTMTACGGSGTAGNVQTTAKGVISGFGSLHVNGVQYATDNATVTMDGVPATVNDLQVGMVVTVKGNINDDRTAGAATAIEFSDLFQGPVSAVDPVANTVTVFGQTIRVDNATFYGHVSGPAALNVGDIVEVSGIPDDTGAIRATHLDKKTLVDEIEIKGQVTGPVGATSFTMQVARNAPHVTVIFPTHLDLLIKEGSYVEVTSTVAGVAGTIVTATSVSRVDGFPTASVERLEMEGYISAFNGTHDVMVNGIPVNASGLAAARSLAVGMKVVVGGTMSNGLLLATSIEEVHESDAMMEGEAFNVAPGTLTFNLLGRTVIVNDRTSFRDDSSGHLRNFCLVGESGVKEGDYLEVSGHLDGYSFLAAKVVRKDRPV